MIENINDFLSVAFLVILLLVILILVLRHFSVRHARKIMDLEREYYFSDFEEDDPESDAEID